MKPTPLIFRPILKRKVWGGDNLRRGFDNSRRRIPADARIGESWEISDREEDVSVVAEGPNRGLSLRELMRRHRRELLGERAAERYKGRFPLLVKLIDAQETLSVQVHPDDARAAALNLSDSGKTEVWHILDARKNGVLYKGFSRPVSRAGLRRLAEKGRLASALRRFAVKRDDVVFCPAGTAHAIGAGVVLLEVQQNSDVTHRLYDWDRPKSPERPLHLEEALAALRFKRLPAREKPRLLKSAPFRRERLVKCRRFEMQRWTLKNFWRGRGADRMEIYHVLRGAGVLRGGGMEVELARGLTLLLPAALRQWEIAPKGTLRLARVTF